VARRRKLSPEQHAEVYRRLRLHYDNAPGVLAAEFGVSLGTLKATFNRERMRRFSANSVEPR
jgi:hypothetical protein